MTRLRIALCVLAFSSGCAHVRPLDLTALEPGALPEVAPNEGILVLCVETEVPIAKLQISRMTAISDLDEGEHLRLLALRAGSYRWTGLVVPAEGGEVPFGLFRSEALEFRVEPGRINYPGHIRVRGSTHGKSVSLRPLTFRNRSAQLLRELRERYPRLLERYPPVYSGHEPDGYLDYYGRTFLAGEGDSPSEGSQ